MGLNPSHANCKPGFSGAGRSVKSTIGEAVDGDGYSPLFPSASSTVGSAGQEESMARMARREPIQCSLPCQDSMEPQAENIATPERKHRGRWCPHLRVNPCSIAQWVSLAQANSVAGISQAQRNYTRDKLGSDGSLIVIRTQTN